MKYIILSSLFSFFILAACGLQTDLKQQAAKHIARPAFMVERSIPTGSFGLNAWERMHQRHAPATIYIEGDSDGIHIQPAQVQNPRFEPNVRGFFGEDATRMNPVGLHLASRDLSENLAYIARPCQSVKFPEKNGCAPRYWKEDRFAPEILDTSILSCIMGLTLKSQACDLRVFLLHVGAYQSDSLRAYPLREGKVRSDQCECRYSSAMRLLDNPKSCIYQALGQ